MAGHPEPFPGTPLLTPGALPALPPDLPAATLERLALPESQSGGTADDAASVALRAAVAAHPNTPAEVLRALAPEYPGEVLGNPALPLLRLAHPRLIYDWPRDTVLRLVRHPLAPDWLRRHALAHARSEFQVALASNPALSAAEMAHLAGHPFWQVRARLATQPGLPPDTLAALAHDPDYGVRLYVAARQDLPPGSVESLRRDPSLFVRQVLEQAQRAGLAAFVLLACLFPG